MDTLFHFVFSVLAALALGLHQKHRLLFVFWAAFFSILIDVDHLFLLFNPSLFPVHRPLHNIFVIIFLPLALFLIAFYIERKKGTTILQSFFLVLMVLLVGHVIADMFFDSVELLYPISTVRFGFPNIEVLIPSQFYLPLISRQGIALAVYGLFICLALFVEDFIYFFEKKHEQAKNALRDTFKDLF